jgi:hypothetical protein
MLKLHRNGAVGFIEWLDELSATPKVNAPYNASTENESRKADHQILPN